MVDVGNMSVQSTGGQHSTWFGIQSTQTRPWNLRNFELGSFSFFQFVFYIPYTPCVVVRYKPDGTSSGSREAGRQKLPVTL